MKLDNHVETTPEEWQRITERASKPLCFNFMVLPKVPEHTDSFYDRNGQPVTTNYDNVDWKGLGKKLQARLNGRVAKNIKVYVADDGPDLFDVYEFRTDRPSERDPDDSFVLRTDRALDQVSLSNYRGGLLKLPDDSGLHLNSVSDSQRPPLTALIVGIKFSNMSQAMDYMTTTIDSLFNIQTGMPMQPMSMIHDDDETGTLPDEVHTWLEEQFGAVYSKECGVLLLSLSLAS